MEAAWAGRWCEPLVDIEMLVGRKSSHGLDVRLISARGMMLHGAAKSIRR